MARKGESGAAGAREERMVGWLDGWVRGQTKVERERAEGKAIRLKFRAPCVH